MKKSFITRTIGIILTALGNSIVFYLTEEILLPIVAVLMIYAGGALVMLGER